MTSPKTNSTILYIVLLIAGTIQLVMISMQILSDWAISPDQRKILLVLRFLINALFIIIFSVKLKKINTLKSEGKSIGEL